MSLYRVSITTDARGLTRNAVLRVPAQEDVWLEADHDSGAKFHAGHILRGRLLANAITYVHRNATDESLKREAARLVLTVVRIEPKSDGFDPIHIGTARVIVSGAKRRNLNRPARFKGTHNDAAFEEWKIKHWSHLPEVRINKVEWHT